MKIFNLSIALLFLEMIKCLNLYGYMKILSLILTILVLQSGHIYDHSPLIITLEKYIDYDKLKPDGSPNSWLILTAVHILTAAPLTFDSSKQQITPKHVLATS